MAQDGEDAVKYNVHSLMAFPEDARNKYCIDTMLAVIRGLKPISKIKGKIPQYKALKKYFASLRDKKEEIMTPVLYMIKPEFRDTFLDALDEIADILELVK